MSNNGNSFIPAAKPIVGEEERKAVDEVLKSGMLAQGAEVAQFEEEFCDQLSNGATGIAVNSGTSALHIGLLSSGVKTGAEVIVPSFTFAATANSVALTGATPVFADVEGDYFCLSPESVMDCITDKTVGIMPVHLYGQPADMEKLRALCDEKGLALYEDCAQAHGASLNGTYVGSFGTFGAFSFYPTKNMTCGEGGMIVTKDKDVERQARLYRNQGMEKRYENEVVGLNNRMTNINAAIGRVQLRKLADWTSERQANAAFLSENITGVQVPAVRPGAQHVYHQYTILVEDDRDGFQKALEEEYGIGSGVYYPVPNHELPSFRDLGVSADLPVTKRLAQTCLSLPVYPGLGQEGLERVVSAVNAVAKAGS